MSAMHVSTRTLWLSLLLISASCLSNLASAQDKPPPPATQAAPAAKPARGGLPPDAFFPDGQPPGVLQAPSNHQPGMGHQGPDGGASDPLDQLRDIHSAPPPSWWPPAPGWWLVAAVAAAFLLFVLRRLAAWFGRRGQRRSILAQFQAVLGAYDAHGDRRRYAMEIDVLLRRLALRSFGRDRAGLTGSAWLELWGAAGDDPVGRILLHAPYQAQPDFDPARLHGWVMERVQRHA